MGSIHDETSHLEEHMTRLSETVEEAVCHDSVAYDKNELRKIERKKYLGGTDYKKLLREMCIPCWVGQIVQALYTTIDSLYIARWSALSVAAMSYVFPFETIISGIGLMNGVGANGHISSALGAGDMRLAEKFLANCLAGVLILGIVVPIILCSALTYLLDLIGTTPDTKPDALKYGYIICGIGPISYVFANSCTNLLRAEGKYKRSVIALGGGAITNIVLDPIFIYAFKMGLAGAAISTVIANFTCGFLGWSYFFVRNPAKRSVVILRWKDVFRPNFKILYKTWSLGASSLLSNLTLSAANLVINIINTKFASSSAEAEAYAASIGSISKILQLFLFSCHAFSQSLIALGAYSIGAGLYRRFRAQVRLVLYWESGIMIFAAIFLCAFATLLPKIFYSNNAYYCEVMTKTLYTLAPSQIFVGIQIVAFPAFLGIKKPLMSAFCSALRQFIIVVPVILILGFTLKSPQYTMIAYPISDFLGFLIIILCFWLYRKPLHLIPTENDGPMNEQFEEVESIAIEE